jgi:hypothetical protein
MAIWPVLRQVAINIKQLAQVVEILVGIKSQFNSG